MTNAVVSETLKHGKKKNNRISLLFIGQDGVGKTSLKKSLLGEESDEKEPSTIGIEFDVVEVNDNDKFEPWRRAADDQLIASENYADGVLGREIARKIAESNEGPKEGGTQNAEQAEGDLALQINLMVKVIVELKMKVKIELTMEWDWERKKLELEL